VRPDEAECLGFTLGYNFTIGDTCATTVHKSTIGRILGSKAASKVGSERR
jgi:hypothetical protein